MKFIVKILFILICFCFSNSFVLSAEPILQVSSKSNANNAFQIKNNPIKNYYYFDGYKFIFVPPSKDVYKSYLKEQRIFYKNAVLKNQKLMVKAEKSTSSYDKSNYYLKIISRNRFYTPALFAMLNLYINNNNVDGIIASAQLLYNDDNDIDKTYLKNILAVANFQKGNYTVALPLLIEMENLKTEYKKYSYKYEIAFSYYSIGDYNNAIKYFQQISKISEDYGNSVSCLYAIYFKQHNYKEAVKYAIELSKLYPSDAGVYLKIATCTDKKQAKLDNLYKALYFQMQKNAPDLFITNDRIADLEQEKINNVVKNLKTFVEIPNWNYVKEQSNFSLSDNQIYWANRQFDFFLGTNACISKYTGANLVKCFEAENRKQSNLTALRLAEIGRRERLLENEYTLVRQQMMLDNAVNEVDVNQRRLIKQLMYSN